MTRTRMCAALAALALWLLAPAVRAEQVGVGEKLKPGSYKGDKIILTGFVRGGDTTAIGTQAGIPVVDVLPDREVTFGPELLFQATFFHPAGAPPAGTFLVDSSSALDTHAQANLGILWVCTFDDSAEAVVLGMKIGHAAIGSTDPLNMGARVGWLQHAPPAVGGAALRDSMGIGVSEGVYLTADADSVAQADEIPVSLHGPMMLRSGTSPTGTYTFAFWTPLVDEATGAPVRGPWTYVRARHLNTKARIRAEGTNWQGPGAETRNTVAAYLVGYR